MQRRKQRKGKGKTRRQMRQGGNGNYMTALPHTGRARIRLIGASQAIPPYKFFRTEYKFQQVQSLSTFAVHTGNTGDTIATGAGVTAGAMAWSIGDLAQLTNFSNIFDQYRITQIDLHIEWFITATPVGATLFVVQDWDDSVVLGSVAAAQSYQSCQVIRPGDSMVCKLQPVTQAASAAGSMIVPSPWLDFATTTNQHRGIKWVCSAGAGNSWIVNAQYTFECYTVR
jgi:hypothetical protein